MSQHSSYLSALADASTDLPSKHAHYLAVRFFLEHFERMLQILIVNFDLVSPV